MFALWSGLTKLCFSACVQTETHLALFSGSDFGPEILEVHDAVIFQPVKREKKKKNFSPSPDLNICRLERTA